MSVSICELLLTRAIGVQFMIDLRAIASIVFIGYLLSRIMESGLGRISVALGTLAAYQQLSI
jgi:hypothetical protein